MVAESRMPNSTTIFPSGADALAADYDWGQYSRILDIGGASGSFLALIMEKHDIEGAVCDQPQVNPSSVPFKS